MPAKKARKKPTAKPKTKPRTKKSKSNKVTVTQNQKVTVSGAGGGGGGGGGSGPPIVYATYAPPIPAMQTSATRESGRVFEPERREMPKFARVAMATTTTSNAAAQTSNKVAQSAMDSYRKMFSGRSSRETQTGGGSPHTPSSNAFGGAVGGRTPPQTSTAMDSYRKLFPGKTTYVPRDPGASTSATWESGNGFKPEKREPQRLTDHGVTITPKHASVQTQATSDMSIMENASAHVATFDLISAEDPRITAAYNKVTDSIQRAKQRIDTTMRKNDLDMLSRAQEGIAEMSS